MSVLEMHIQSAPLPPYPPSSVTTQWVREYTEWFDQLNIIVGKRYGDSFLSATGGAEASE